MTDRITAILDVLRAAEIQRDTICEGKFKSEYDFIEATSNTRYNLERAVEAMRKSTEPNFAKLVEAALPCDQYLMSNPDGCCEEGLHSTACPAYYRPTVLRLISAILANERKDKRHAAPTDQNYLRSTARQRKKGHGDC